jgi:deoxyribonuclease-4
MSNEAAAELGRCARALDITLSVHAPYYINLASLDADKLLASRRRLLDTCERAHHMGAGRVVFHAGFYQKRDPKDVFGLICDELSGLSDVLAENGWQDVLLCPETTGKASQFGGLNELLDLSEAVPCGICVDFAHLYARNGGCVDYGEVIKKLRSLSHIHGHFSGISYTPKGEQRHKNLRRSFFVPLSEALQMIGAHQTVTLISEVPPNPLRGAVNMKRWMWGGQ